IQLLLEQAQLGLLRGDQAVYTASLNEAAKRVKAYLRTNTGEAEAFLTKLSDLSAAIVQSDVPSIEGSVRAVKVFRDFWQQEKIERQLGRNAIEAATEPAPVVEQ
ncbi:MAG: uroporphyrinogen-III C-methyltransferase, partial [Pseudomonadales bacterium]|nr:uroporphyrinogen-III C-methyltransferase [Pseudomonadales bacterium]